MLATATALFLTLGCLLAPDETPRSAASRADLLAMMPRDTAVAVAVNFRAEIVSEALIRKIAAFAAPQNDAPDLHVDLLASIPGEMAFGFVPKKRRDRDNDRDGDGDIDVVVVMDLSKPGFDLHDWLSKKLLPLIGATNPHNDKARARIAGELPTFTIEIPGADKPALYIAVRGKIAVASNDSRLVRAAHMQKNDPRESLVSAPGVRRVARELPKHAAAWVLFQPEPFIAAQPKPKPRSRDELLMQILNPEDLHAAAAYLDISGNAIELGALAMLNEECKGLARILSGSNSESALQPKLSTAFPVTARIGCENLSELPTLLYQITDRFDETIGVEYREDLAAFNKTTGVDLNANLLSQIHDEFVLVVRPDFSQQPPVAWALVTTVKDPTVFASAAEKLTAHFGLTFDTREQAGLQIHTATGMTPVAWTLAGKHLVIAIDAKTVRDTAKVLLKSAGSASASRGLTRLDRSNQFYLNVDLPLLAQQAPMLPMLAGAQFGPLVKDGSLAAALTRDGQFSRFRLRWDLGKGRPSQDGGESGIGGEEVLAFVADQAIDALTSARHEAQRVVGMSNMRAITQGLYIYAEAHGGQFPDSLAELVKSNNLTLEQLKNPYTNEGPTDLADLEDKSHLVYRPGLTNQSAPNEIVFAERFSTANNRGQAMASFAFVDGHVESLEEPLASLIINMIESGAPSVTVDAARAALANGGTE